MTSEAKVKILDVPSNIRNCRIFLRFYCQMYLKHKDKYKPHVSEQLTASDHVPFRHSIVLLCAGHPRPQDTVKIPVPLLKLMMLPPKTTGSPQSNQGA